LRTRTLAGLAGLVSACVPAVSQAANIDGSQMSVWWGVPFAGLLLSIALCPLLTPVFWHHHFGKVALGWALAFLVPCAVVFGFGVAGGGAVHAFVAEYIPFIILVTSLFVVAGGICVRGNLHGTPALNTGLLALGTLLASIMGTTGASMLMIRPLIRANDNRKHAVHIVVFFIFLVSNAGGSLTPLGDPPLFLGFLKGVDFFWTMKNIFPETLFLCMALLVIFYLLDHHYYNNKEEEFQPSMDPTPDSAIRFEGRFNFVLLVVIVGLVLMSGLWNSGVVFNVLGTEVELQNLVRDVLLVAVIFISLWLTPKVAREGNEFSWGPIQEVAKLFAGIFITIIPVIAMLRAGEAGAFSAVVRAVTDEGGQPINAMYFWASGLLSSFLDNAILQYSRRRPGRTDDHPCEHTGSDLLRLGVHGRKQLYRQCPQHDGESDRGRARHQDAVLLRLHGLVLCGSRSAVHSDDIHLLSVMSDEQRQDTRDAGGISRRH
jgi:Na+/H+ antiporter NhaD/arsenite permease-like protein